MVEVKNQIMLSFDLELWHEGVSLRKYLPENKENLPDCLTEAVLPILDLLSKYQAQATFFATGQVLEKYPKLIREISGRGHKIASHGLSHCLLDELSPDQFKEEIKKSKELIEKTTGHLPQGFRAPNLSLNKETSWALNILADQGFKYDSSIFPFKILGAPADVYRISLDNPSQADPDSPLIEIPLTCYSLAGLKVPIAGSVYFRLLPFFLYVKMLRSVQKKRIPILYFHPWELYQNSPRVKGLPWLNKISRYYGTKKSLGKFEGLLKAFRFNSIENILKV